MNKYICLLKCWNQHFLKVLHSLQASSGPIRSKKFQKTVDFSLHLHKLHFFPYFSAALCIQRLSVPKLFGSFCRKNPKNRKPKTTKSFSLLALTFVQSFQTVGYVFHVPNPEQNKDAASCYVKNKIFFFGLNVVILYLMLILRQNNQLLQREKEEEILGQIML